MKKHNFTWKGEPVTASILAGILGIVQQTIYIKSREAGSDKGEDIAACIGKKYNSKVVEIWWEGKMTKTTDIAKELGIANFTLLVRLRKYGKDSFLTYWPGKIPRWLVIAHPASGVMNKGTKEYQKLSTRPRNSNLDKIKLGKWELAQC